MIVYKLTLHFDNLDNFMGTDDQARVAMNVESDSYGHAFLLAQRFCKVLEADRFDLEENYPDLAIDCVYAREI